MLLHGDEVSRTQGGNNNAYCQDNEVTWQRWDLCEDERAILEWTKRVIALRRHHAVLRRRNYFRGRPIRGTTVKDIAWLVPQGGEMTDLEWHDPETRTLGMLLAGVASDLTDEEGRPIIDDTLLILMNVAPKDVSFRIPAAQQNWVFVLDTAKPDLPEGSKTFRPGTRYPLTARSIAILKVPAAYSMHPPRWNNGEIEDPAPAE